jgi:4-amino-4-deoxy-L-arabinose transferase-like glycosyltransferase
MFASATKNPEQRNFLFWLPLPIGIGLFAYIVYRSVFLSMTHDEASTYLSYVPRPIWEILTYAQPTTANNHILNTLLIKFLTQFGDAVWLIRLPNTLAGAGYLIYSYILSRRLFKAPGPVLAGFLFLTFNAYLLDFFSVARGYGLGLCFLMGSLYFLQRFITNRQLLHWVMALGFALLAVYSNMTMLNYFACLVVVGVVAIWMQHRGNLLQTRVFYQVLLVGVAAVVMVAILVGPAVYTLMTTDELYFAGQQGFFQDTYRSLIKAFLYRTAYFSSATTAIFFALSLAMHLFFLWLIGRAAVRGRWQLPNAQSVLFAILLLLMAVSLVLQFHLFGVLYVRERLAVYFYPVLAIISGYGMLYLPEKRSIRTFISIGICVLLSYHFFFRSVNFDRTYEWPYDRNTHQVMTEINALGTPTKRIRLGAAEMYQPAILYYQTTGQFPNLEPIRWDPVFRRDTFFDYYMIFKYQLEEVHSAYQIDYRDEDLFLMKRKD